MTTKHSKTTKKRAKIGGGFKHVPKMFRDHIGGAAQNPKEFEKTVLITGINLILLTKDVIIKRLKHMNADIVKQIFIKNAYTWARSIIKVNKTHASNAEKIVIGSPTYIDYVERSDPFYGYTKFIHGLSNNTLKKPANVATILNRDISKLDANMKKNASLYEFVQEPKQWQSVYEAAPEYTKKSYMDLLEYHKEKLYLLNVVPPDPRITEYRLNSMINSNSSMCILEKKILRNYALIQARPLFRVELIFNLYKLLDFRPQKIDLLKHYCPNGERHKTGSYLYAARNSKNKPLELQTDEILEWYKGAIADKKDEKTINANRKRIEELDGLYVVNEKCGKCGTLIYTANSGETSDKSLSKLFKKIDDLLAFYEYYETRCPKGDLHEFKIIDSSKIDKTDKIDKSTDKSTDKTNKKTDDKIHNTKERDQTCFKCGFDTELKKKRDRTYYDKYSPQFKRIETEKMSLALQDLDQNIEIVRSANASREELMKEISNRIGKNENKSKGGKSAKIKSDASGKDLPYLNSHQYTAEWSQKLSIKYNLLINMGLSEYVKYEDLETASINPSKNSPNWRLQSLKIRGYILHVIREYNMFKLDELYDLPILKDIKGAQNKADTNVKLPDFNFIDVERDYKLLPTDKYVNFLMEYLAKMILDLGNCKGKIIADKLPIYFTKHIINSERMLSKAAAVFKKTDESIDKLEDASDDETLMSGDNFTDQSSGTEVLVDENANEVYKNEINLDGYDVENEADIWEVE